MELGVRTFRYSGHYFSRDGNGCQRGARPRLSSSGEFQICLTYVLSCKDGARRLHSLGHEVMQRGRVASTSGGRDGSNGEAMSPYII